MKTVPINTDDDPASRRLAKGISLILFLAAVAASAQESVDDIGPAVDTTASEAVQEPAEDIGPAVDTSAASGVQRRSEGPRVMDSIALSRTEITGNQELPTVMYIVPWKKADPSDLMGKPVNTLLDEVLAPIDREEFVRQVDYYQELHAERDQE